MVEKNQELSLKNEFPPTVVRMDLPGGLTATTNSDGHITLQDKNGNVKVIEQGNITPYSTDIKGHPRFKDPTSIYADKITATTGKFYKIGNGDLVGELLVDGCMKIGDQIYDAGDELPYGWIYLKISPATGNPYSLEPPYIEPEQSKGLFNTCLDFMFGEEVNILQRGTSWVESNEHANCLLKEGFENARQPLEMNPDSTELKGNEWLDIYKKIIKGKCNTVAKLSSDLYWGSQSSSIKKDIRLKDFERARSLKDGARTYTHKEHDYKNPYDGLLPAAHTRSVRDEKPMPADCSPN